jgi:hypothetical protein
MGNWMNSNFSIDSILRQTFEGYTQGASWNGWACPYFERTIAERVLRASEANNYNWRYDSESDAFIVQSKDDPEDYDPEVFNGVKINIADMEIVVYGIGAFSWVWEEISTVR